MHVSEMQLKPSVSTYSPGLSLRAATQPLEALRNFEFESMVAAFSPTGGIAGADDIAGRMRRRNVAQPISRLARWVVSRTAICFEWKSHLLLPVFQFDPGTMQPRSVVVEVGAELRDCLDPWELAAWFAHPSPWLNGKAPVEELSDDPESLLAAARTDRFVLRG